MIANTIRKYVPPYEIINTHNAYNVDYSHNEIKYSGSLFINNGIAVEAKIECLEGFNSFNEINTSVEFYVNGYDDTQPGGCVYGPYSVKDKGEKWPARMSVIDKKYVNDIRDKLGWVPPLVNDDIELSKKHFNEKSIINIEYSFFYDKTVQDARMYEGEWSWQLYAKDIWSADIELSKKQYDEGVRGDGSRDYKNQISNLNKLTPVLKQFIHLLMEFPWKK